jgi:hypothetical protein
VRKLTGMDEKSNLPEDCSERCCPGKDVMLVVCATMLFTFFARLADRKTK